MTSRIAEAARSAAREGTTIVAMNPETGPPAIQGPEDGESALPGLFALFEEAVYNGGYDAAMIACFDDTGLTFLKQRSPIPVIGIGEAAFHMAMLRAARFSVVTTLSVSVPVIERNLKSYGFATRCARVRASEVPVLDLATAGSDAWKRIHTEIALSLHEEKPEAIVLGCAGMADLAAAFSSEFKVPVIDGVAAGVALCEAVVGYPN